MSQNTTTQNIVKIVNAAIFIQLIAISAYADGTCLLNKSDISEDMKKIAAKLEVKYGQNGLQKAASIKFDVSNIYDNQELKVDRSVPFLKQVNAVGIVSDSPISSANSYASAILISPCHVLINAHSVTQKNARSGKAPVYVSVGQTTCDSKNEFEHQDMPGKVVTMGDYSDDPAKIDPSKDYAIVRIKAVADIDPIILGTSDITANDSLMIVGFPHKETYSQTTGLRYPTANFVRTTDSRLNGTFTMSNTLPRPGGSGSGVFVLDQDNGRPQVVLSGIHQSEGGRGLQTEAILKHLKLNNPKISNEVIAAIENGTCS